MTIWTYQEVISRRLLAWAALSAAAGFSLLRLDAFWRAFGQQAIGWAVVDAGIALLGRSSARRRQVVPTLPALVAREHRSLSRLLWINAGLDLLYMVGGRALATRRRAGQAMRGAGWGIVAQGAFLFLFDLYHVLNLPPEEAE